MTPREHLELVVRPNMAAMAADPADIRVAFNAIAAVDALAAHIYWWAFHNKPSRVSGVKDDTGYRLQLAQRDNDFRLLFETAKTVKHSRLTHGKVPPSVRAIDQVASKDAGWDNFRWDDFRWDTPQVRIEPIGDLPWAVDGVLGRALTFLEGEMTTLGIP